MTTDIRVGDRFLIEVKSLMSAAADSEPWVPCVAAGSSVPFHIPPHNLLAGKRLPRAIRVGDRVRVQASIYDSFFAKVIALDGEDAWVIADGAQGRDGARSTRFISDLTLCDEASS